MFPMGHVVKEGTLQNTYYRICDDSYQNRTQQEIDRTFQNLAEIGRHILLQKSKPAAP